jgi:hypothetical protein
MPPRDRKEDVREREKEKKITVLSAMRCSCCVSPFVFCRLCFRLRAALLRWFSLSFATCFGLHGHLQVCRIFYFHMPEGFCFAAFLVHCLSLHVSAYMAIFKCVGYFIFICLKDSASLLFWFTVFHYMFQPTWPSSSV